MKKFNKNLIVVLVVLSFVFVLPGFSLAATTPSLGVAGSFSVLANTFTRNIGVTTLVGDLGYTTLSGGGSNTVSGTTHIADGTYNTAGTDQGNALSTGLNTQPCTFTFAPGPIDLAIDTTHGPIGVYTPGVYCTAGGGAASVGTAGIILYGNGTYIFRILGALTTVANANVTLANGASSCDVFWTPGAGTTIGANNNFTGTIIDASGITVGSTTTWNGRALAFGGTVTTDTDTISSLCTTAGAVVAASGGGPLVTQPPLISILKVPTPLSLPAGPGSVTYNYAVSNIGTVPMSNVTVADNMCPSVGFVGGDTNGNSMLDVNEIWNYSCTMNLSQTTTNTVTAMGHTNGLTAIDTANATVAVGVPIIPPLIHVVKVPSVFVLPAGGGPVTYTYTVTNPGTAPLSNVTISDDKCTGLPGRVLGHPGDLNKNDLLENNESWSFTCQTNLTQTTTNTGTASGNANGLTAVDYSLATVVVDPPALPKTGFPPEEKNNVSYLAIISGILALASVSFILVKKSN
jgi:uncharacterized repeat protein (TIGR01451 family)